MTTSQRRSAKRFVLPALVAIGGVLAAAGWIVSSPSGAGPDDIFHVSSILCPSPIDKHCQIVGHVDDNPSKPIIEVPARLTHAACFAFNPNQSADCLYGVPADAMARNGTVDNGQYPAGYFTFMHIFSSPSPAALDRTVMIVRAVNALIAALFFGALAWLLPWTMKRLLVYVLIGFSVPLAIYFLTSVNPTAWGLIGVISAWFALTGLFATRRGSPTRPPRVMAPAWRRRALAGVAIASAALAAAARPDASTYCVIAVLAVGAVHLPELNPRLWRGHRLTWATMIAVTVIGIIGTFTGSQANGLLGLGAGTGNRTVLFYNFERLPALLTGFWNTYLGWFDVPTLPITTVLASSVGLGMLYLGLRRMSVYKAISAGGVFVVIVGVPLFTLQMSGNLVGQNVQPRYFAPLVLVLAAVLLSRRRHDGAKALSLTQTWITYCCLVVAQSFALHSLIKRYVIGWDDMTQNLNRSILWWRAWLPSPMMVWLLASLGFALLALLLFRVRHNQTEVSPT